MNEISNVRVYAVGATYASACVPATMSREDVEKAVNVQHPTGTESKWQITEEAFMSGKSNPHPCDSKPDNTHYLLSC